VRELIEGTGCGVLLLHHLPKYAVDSGSTVALSGAHRWAGKADAVAYLHFANREGQDRVRFTVAKDRDGEKRVMEFLRQGRRFIPLQSEAVPTGDWGVVRAYLQEHGEATYRELLDALQEAGLCLTERALQARVKRWESRGRLVIERRGFPAMAIVKLPVAQFTHLPPQWDSHVQTVQTEQTVQTASLPPVYSECTDYTDYSDCTEEPCGVPTAEPASTPAYDPASESFAEWLERADRVLDQYAPSFHDRVELAWDTIDDWLQRASMPNDPLGLEPHEVEAIRLLLAFAEARGFPSLTLPEYGYTIQAGRDGWLNALPDIAGTPAVATATRLLQALDTAGEPVVPEPNTLTNGDAGSTPSQLSLMEG
jgi:hypothetical protein